MFFLSCGLVAAWLENVHLFKEGCSKLAVGTKNLSTLRGPGSLPVASIS